MSKKRNFNQRPDPAGQKVTLSSGEKASATPPQNKEEKTTRGDLILNRRPAGPVSPVIPKGPPPPPPSPRAKKKGPELPQLLERVRLLREACATTSADNIEKKALNRRFAESLILLAQLAQEKGDGALAYRALGEAATALRNAEKHEEAGKLLEQLGRWKDAANAYQAAGALEAMEAIFARLEHRDAKQKELNELLNQIDESWFRGDRFKAHQLIRELKSQHGLQDHEIPSELRDRLQRLREGKIIPEKILTLQISGSKLSERNLRICFKDRLSIGRGPDNDLILNEAGVSRSHATIEFRTPPEDSLEGQDAPEPNLSPFFLIDLGSKAGSFWEGDALVPGQAERVGESGALALGLAPPLEIHRLGRPSEPTLGIRNENNDDYAWLFLPQGGPLFLDPTRTIPIELRWENENLKLTARPEVETRLFGTTIGSGTSVDLLHGDRLTLSFNEDAPSTNLQSDEATLIHIRVL